MIYLSSIIHHINGASGAVDYLPAICLIIISVVVDYIKIMNPISSLVGTLNDPITKY